MAAPKLESWIGGGGSYLRPFQSKTAINGTATGSLNFCAARKQLTAPLKS